MVRKSHNAWGSALASVFQKFHGIRPMAEKVGVPPSTVKSWHKKGHIPPWRHRSILDAAKKYGVSLSADELTDIQPDDAADLGRSAA